MTNEIKADETGGIPETPTELLSQLSVSVSTTGLAESISNIISDTEFKNGNSDEAFDTVKSSSKVSSVKPLKEADNVKQNVVEEVKTKIPKGDHIQSSNGKNVKSCSKRDSDEENSGDLEPFNADNPSGSFKVSSSTIEIPTTDADMSTRTNGKNDDNQSHHYTAMPYVALSKETSPTSNQSNLPETPQKAISDTITEEEQNYSKSRVLCSSNRCGSSAVPATTSSESTTAAAVLDIELHPKRHILKAIRNEFKTSSTSFANNVIEDDTQATTSSTSSGSTKTTNVSGSRMALHPKRCKIKPIINKSKTSDIFSTTNITAEETNPSNTTSDSPSFTNDYQMFLNIRKQIDKRRNSMFSVQPKPPSGFENYLMNRRTYVLDNNYKSHEVNTQTPPPANLHKQLKKLFDEQEKERQKLRVQHIVDKEKMVLSVEQEILRVHGRIARFLTNQSVPFSVCTFLMDDEVYNIMTPEQEEKNDENECSNYDGHIFYSWLQEVDDKWEKIMKSLLMRHHNEADSLHNVQKMEWGWKLKELKLSSSSEHNINEKHVPIVLVN